ncbi:MAG: DUF2281 domain-containing protein [bacterium]
MSNKDLIINEIDKLPDNLLPEVLDFIKFLELKKQNGLLIKSSGKLSENVFNAIWDNEEDAAYDGV